MTGLEPLLPFAVFGGLATLGVGAFLWSCYQDEKRRRELADAALRLGLEFSATGPSPSREGFDSLHIFTLGHSRTHKNLLSGRPDGTDGILIWDYQYTTGSGKNRQTHHQTVAALSYPKGGLPGFELRPENLFHRIGSLFGYQDIDLPAHPGFSKAYLLRGKDEEAIRDLFGLNLVQFFEGHPDWCVEGEGSWLVVYRAGKRIRPADIPSFVDETRLVLWAFPR